MMNNIHLYSRYISDTFNTLQSANFRALKSVSKYISDTNPTLFKFKNIKKTNKKEYLK